MANPLFNLASLHKIGTLADDFDAQFAAAVRDCRDRPQMDKAREVVLRIKVVPSPSDKDDVIVTPVTTSKTPAREILPYLMQTNSKGQARFAPSSPMDPNQRELYDDEE